jgi:uncharacterized protein involved in exopolysaccharide biosynthesis
MPMPIEVVQPQIGSNIKLALQSARIRREDLVQKYTDRHPKVVAVDNQIRDLQYELRQEIQNQHRAEEKRLDQIVARQSSIESEIASIRVSLGEIPDKEMELNRLDNEIQELESKYKLLMDKQNEAQIALASTPEWDVTVLSPASPPFARKTKDYVRIALGPVLSLVVGLGLAFFFESVDHSLKNASEVEEYLGATVLATFAQAREKQ